MTIIEILTIIALFGGPLAAVQIQKYIEKFKERRDRKLYIFKTLMGSRGERVSFEHVRALNMIDIEFYNKKEITDAWENYLNSLEERADTSESRKVLAEKRNNMFVTLLNKMGKLLGYHFNEVYLKKRIYVPEAHEDNEEYQYFIKGAMKDLFSGKTSIPIKLVPTKNTDEDQV